MLTQKECCNEASYINCSSGSPFADSEFGGSNQQQFCFDFAPLGYPNYDFSVDPGGTMSTIDTTADQAAAAETPMKMKRESGRFDAMYMNMEADSFDLTALGAFWTKDEHGEHLGGRTNVGFYFGSGDAMQDAEITIMGFNAAWMLTYGAKKDNLTPVFFVGPAFGFSYTNVDVVVKNDSYTMDSVSLLFGGTIGVQLLIDTGDFIISPAYCMTIQQGASETYNSFTETSDSDDFSSNTTSISFDVLHKNTGITLSGILQAAKEDDEAIDTTIIRFGKTF